MNYDGVTVEFDVFLTPANLIRVTQEGLLKKFKLTTTISTTNMHLFDPRGVIKKYDNPEQSMWEKLVFFTLIYQYNFHDNTVTLCDFSSCSSWRIFSFKTWILWEKKGELTYAHGKRVELLLNNFSHFLGKQLLTSIFVICAEISTEQTWNGVVEVGKQG